MNLGFHLMFKTADLQDVIYTSMADDNNVIINKLYLFIPNLMPSVETQLMFNEATQNNYKISYEESYTERRVIPDLLVQHDIRSAQQVDSPKYMIRAHQMKNRIETPNKNDNIAIFDNLDLRKSFVEIDSSTMNYEENDFIEQYKDLKLFFKECIVEPLLDPFISYPDMKTKYSNGITDLRHQPDPITPKRIQLFQKYGTDPDNARLFVILVRQREIELVSDGSKLIDVKVI